MLVSLVALWGFMRGWFAIRAFDARLCAGAYMHLACALLGAVGGAGALVKEDPGGFIGPDGLLPKGSRIARLQR